MSRLLCLVENGAARPDLRAEHGLAMWLEHRGRCLLFDTGQTGDVLRHNAERLGVDLGRTNAVVLSHGHYDHTGGLAAVLKCAPNADVYAHPDAWRARFACDKDGAVRDVGMPRAGREAAESEQTRVIAATGHREVVPGAYATGAVPCAGAGRRAAGRFFRDRECREPDAFADDQALYFESAEGLVVLLGCAHAGVIDTLRHVQRLAPNRPMRAVIGGMHLRNASAARIRATMDALEDMGIRLLRGAHCTGAAAMERGRTLFGDRWQGFPAGAELTFADCNSS